MRAFLSRAAKYVLYPLFYLFCLVVCFYITFPWDSLKQKIIADFAKSQSSKGDKAWRLEIGSISGYWFTGVEMDDARIIMPASDDEEDAKKPANPNAFTLNNDLPADTAPPADAKTKDGKDPKAAKGPTESVVTISHVNARVEVLPLLIGRVRVDFKADAFGGNVHGVIPLGGGTLDVEVENVDLGQVAPLRDLVSLPLKGVANGKLEIVAADNGKWAKSSGSLDMTITDVVLGDGKAKLMGKATLPPAQLGNFDMNGKVTDGVLKLDKFGATGKDVDVIGEGSLRLKEPWDASALDLFIRFSFSDSYRSRDDKTLGLFGDPKDPTSVPALDFIPKLKKAKRADGFWGFRGHGALKRLKWDPTKEDGPAKTAVAGASASPDSDSDLPTPTPVTGTKRPNNKRKTSYPSDGESPPPAPAFKNVPAPSRVGAEPDQVGGPNPGPDQIAQPVPDSPSRPDPAPIPPALEGPAPENVPPVPPPQDMPPQ